MDSGWYPYIMLLLGLFACGYAWRILATGTIEGEGGALRRENSPVVYWFLVLFILASGLGLIAGGGFALTLDV